MESPEKTSPLQLLVEFRRRVRVSCLNALKLMEEKPTVHSADKSTLKEILAACEWARSEASEKLAVRIEDVGENSTFKLK